MTWDKAPTTGSYNKRPQRPTRGATLLNAAQHRDTVARHAAAQNEANADLAVQRSHRMPQLDRQAHALQDHSSPVLRGARKSRLNVEEEDTGVSAWVVQDHLQSNLDVNGVVEDVPILHESALKVPAVVTQECCRWP